MAHLEAQQRAASGPEQKGLLKALRQLEKKLGSFVFRWLQACAFFPAIRLPITLHLGAALSKADGREPPTEEEAMSLCALPWFRQGWMPDDLRGALLMLQSEADQQITREALEALAFTSATAAETNAAGGATVLRVSPAPKGWARRWADWRAGLPQGLAEHDDVAFNGRLEPTAWDENQQKFVLLAVAVTSLLGLSLSLWFLDALGWAVR